MLPRHVVGAPSPPAPSFRARTSAGFHDRRGPVNWTPRVSSKGKKPSVEEAAGPTPPARGGGGCGPVPAAIPLTAQVAAFPPRPRHGEEAWICRLPCLPRPHVRGGLPLRPRALRSRRLPSVRPRSDGQDEGPQRFKY